MAPCQPPVETFPQKTVNVSTRASRYGMHSCCRAQKLDPRDFPPAIVCENLPSREWGRAVLCGGWSGQLQASSGRRLRSSLKISVFDNSFWFCAGSTSGRGCRTVTKGRSDCDSSKLLFPQNSRNRMPCYPVASAIRELTRAQFEFPDVSLHNREFGAETGSLWTAFTTTEAAVSRDGFVT